MSISNTTDKIGPFLVTGLPQVIPVSFPFQQGSDLLVLDTGTSGTTQDPALVLELNSDYTVTGGGYDSANTMQVGSITVVSTGTNAVAVGDYLVIMRAVPINQTTSFQASGPLTIQMVEQALDKQATLSQQVNEVAGRSLQFENFEFLSPVLPLESRKGKMLGFDANGAVNFLQPTSSIGVDVSQDTVIATDATTSRTLANYFGDIVNVKNYGAKGDGVTDDTAAIQAAINQAEVHNYQTVYFPGSASFYKTTGELLITGPIKLMGAHPGVAIKAYGLNSAQHVLKIDGTVNPNLEFVCVENLEFITNNGVASLVLLSRVSYCEFLNVRLVTGLHGITQIGNRTFSNSFINVNAYGLSGYGWYFNGYAGGGQQSFISCSAVACLDGVVVDSTSAVTGMGFVSCNFEANTAAGVDITGSVTGISFCGGCRFESNSLEINIRPGAANTVYGLVIQGCEFGTNTGAASAIVIGGGAGKARGISITGNHALGYATQFINLNGDGSSSEIVGNQIEAVPAIVSAGRAGCFIANNENNTGPVGQRITATLLNVSADRGDNSVSLVVGADATIQRFATALTGNKTVSLPAGGSEGDSFRIVRSGLGAFTLNVGGLKTIPNSTAAFVDVAYSTNASAWILTAYGTL